MNQELIWYVFIEGEQTGPHSKEAIYELLETGKVSGADFVWREGFDDWVKLESVDEFADIFDDVIVGEDDDASFEAGQTVGGLQRGSILAEEARAEADADDVPDFKEMEGAVEDFFASISDDEPQRADAPPAEVQDDLDDDLDLSGVMSSDSSAFGDDDQDDDDDDDDIVQGFSLAGAAKATAPKSELLEERSDDSVLFDLDALSGSAGQSSGNYSASSGAPVDDGSGLIDIAALTSASSTIAKDRSVKLASNENEAAAAPAAQSQPIGAGVPLRATKRRGGGVPIGIVAAIIVILLLVGAVVLVLQKKSNDNGEQNQVATTGQPGDQNAQQAGAAGSAGGAAGVDNQGQNTDPTQDNAAEGAQGVDDQAVAMADASDASAEVADEQSEGDEAAQADEGQEQVAAAPERNERESQARQERARPSAADREREEAAAARRSAEREREAAQREARAERQERSQGSSNSGSSGSAVDNALAAIERGNDDSGSGSEGSSGGSAAGSELSSGQIRSTVRRYGSRIARCKRSDADAGTYRIGVVIQPDGSVSSVEGQSGEPNQCIARVASGIRFPAFSGSAKAIRIPFVIH